MPFGLKNIGATYQRMVTKMFESIMGKTMDAYIDVVVRDLTEVFTIMKRHKLRLSAAKCAFGVSSKNFLG